MDPRLLSYLYFFNIKRDYYECHEYGEALWLDSGRPQVLKGLIQAAVCLYHLQSGNVRGGYAMWVRARKYLEPYMPVYEQINLERLRQEIDRVFAKVPSEWYDQTVAQEKIAALQLPIVSIWIEDDAIQSALHTFVPPSHDEERIP
ncbi:DUF309 domain-containing protein [Sulfoacidibacillus thermotolerans]|uniref:DUF309 domain-containing protein n=1 Tax=Sulfoacidibacillus thermotolerans TaxID=1765684 RepID=A0A2U3D6F3_SULT2|nr:DUF309 domain-containing protein [Sulfoacidibacillus thermotolerans]PWI56861.1 hypothetical protein BM613_11530 [Sulfoacidibacillus thermotolerans]